MDSNNFTFSFYLSMVNFVVRTHGTQKPKD